MEWAIEKATELGIARITPILARRTEKHLAQSAAQTSRTLAPHRPRSRQAIPPHRHPRHRRPHRPQASPRTRNIAPPASSSAKPNKPPPSPPLLQNSQPYRTVHRFRRSESPRPRHRPRRRLDPRRNLPLHPTPMATRHPRPPHPPRRNRRHRRHRHRRHSPEFTVQPHRRQTRISHLLSFDKRSPSLSNSPGSPHEARLNRSSTHPPRPHPLRPNPNPRPSPAAGSSPPTSSAPPATCASTSTRSPSNSPAPSTAPNSRLPHQLPSRPHRQIIRWRHRHLRRHRPIQHLRRNPHPHQPQRDPLTFKFTATPVPPAPTSAPQHHEFVPTVFYRQFSPLQQTRPHHQPRRHRPHHHRRRRRRTT